MFKALIDKLTRAPFGTREERVIPPPPTRSALCVGDSDSALRLTLLDRLSEAAQSNPRGLCGFVFGLPVEAVERVLASAGFDVAAGYHTPGRARVLHRFTDANGRDWCVAGGELTRAAAPVVPESGSSCSVPESWCFADAVNEPGGRVRFLATGEVVDRPRRLIYVGASPVREALAWDCLADAGNAAECMARLRRGGVLGLNSERCLTACCDMFFLVREPITVPALRHVLSDHAARDGLLAPTEEFLEGGRVFHFDPASPIGLCAGLSLKVAAEKEALAKGARPGRDLLFLFENWNIAVAADLDESALPLPDMNLVYGVAECEKLMSESPAAARHLFSKFPNIVWHRSRDERLRELVKDLAPVAWSSGLRLGELAWARRVCSGPSGVRDETISGCCDAPTWREFHRDHPTAATGDSGLWKR